MKQIFIAAIVASLAGSALAFAEEVVVTVERYSFPPIIVSVPGRDVHAGQYQTIEERGPSEAWCAEIEQTLQFGTPIAYQVIDGVSAWGPAKATDLDELLSLAAALGWPSNAEESAWIQVSIWDILAGRNPLIDADQWPVSVHASLLENGNRQNLLVTTPSVAVDEPQPAALLLSGLGLCFAFFRQQAKACRSNDDVPPHTPGDFGDFQKGRTADGKI